ncbi:hypothetical protein C8Q80DRAFT_1215055 [Daedaleopsis nitida]|nr:hypothetical protein C8Q80DRAFT_1215055 [Daedaleopsis nitida]
MSIAQRIAMLPSWTHSCVRVALQDAGITEVFEAAAAFGKSAPGSDWVRPNAVRALKAMGSSMLCSRSPTRRSELEGVLFYTGVGAHELIYDVLPPAPEDTSISMHRAAFLDALVGRVDPADALQQTLHLNLGIPPSRAPPRTRHVVLGADGIKSAVRRFVVDCGAAATATGTDTRVAFSNTLHLREDLQKEFEGWGPDVATAPLHAGEDDPWSVHVVHPPLESYARGRVALLGDAVRSHRNRRPALEQY